MKVLFKNHTIEFDESANNRPNSILIDGDEFTMSNTAAEHGFSWRTSASGNVLYYSSPEHIKVDGGLLFAIEQRKFIEWHKTGNNKYAAQSAWDKTHTTQVMLKLNNNTDADILAKLETVESKQGYIKQLIRRDLQNEV